MAIGDPYANPADLELRLGRPDPGTFADDLAAASQYLETYCHRQFNKETAATARTFRPLSGCFAVVDDFHTVTGLVIKTDEDGDGSFETTWTTADYELVPLGGVVGGVTGWPFFVVRAVGSRLFPCNRRASLQVTAQWGWAAVPYTIKKTTLETAASLSAMDAGAVQSESLDGYSVTYQQLSAKNGPLAKADGYRLHTGISR